ncbi:O-methyltransferase [Nesterenkonia sp. HG001]|uniref:O-methyltransferase n=1 Tax=Nesterenkonia sp. HG001 TaxID=2983207 RepID=UPI002AC4B1E0|nr:class I SAM-dependent methyltransferase [Nesterenkonia sp. HG001]MDZ5076336.1 class I SAM-dependent methyltransferase [Nesterenkonia sp. HG001]
MRTLNSPQTAKHASWEYAEQHQAEDHTLEAARLRGKDLGLTPVSEGTAAALTVLAAAAQARGVVEVGTGVGVSGLSLLRGASPEAVLTSIDPDADHLHAARATFRDGGVPVARTRLITGRAEEVLPRLTTGGYCVVHLDADSPALEDFVEQAVRLLRPGGLLILNDALDHDRLPRPAVREEPTVRKRAVERAVRDDERLVTTMLGTGTGLLVAVRR